MNQEAVIHFAVLTGTEQSMYQMNEYTRANVGGTAALLEHLTVPGHSVDRATVASFRSICREGKYIRGSDGPIAFSGSRKNVDIDAGIFDVRYGASSEALVPVATSEGSQLSPVSVYAFAKLSQEKLVLTLCEGIGIAAFALRYRNFYGPGQSLQNPYTGILSIFSRAFMENREINIFEDEELRLCSPVLGRPSTWIVQNLSSGLCN